MRNLLVIIFFIYCWSGIGQEQSQQLIEQTAQKVGIQNSDIFSRLSTSQQFDKGILIVIPEIAEQGDGYMIFNSHVILINKNTRELKAKFSGKKDWYIDAVSIDKIEIEPGIYQLNEKTEAFGLKISYSNRSRPNPYSSTQLSLYALEGDKLNQVLKDFPITTLKGETDTTCRGEFKEERKDVEVLETFTNEFADLKFSNVNELSERNEDCEKVIRETSNETEILKYGDGQYKSSKNKG